MRGGRTRETDRIMFHREAIGAGSNRLIRVVMKLCQDQRNREPRIHKNRV